MTFFDIEHEFKIWKKWFLFHFILFIYLLKRSSQYIFHRKKKLFSHTGLEWYECEYLMTECTVLGELSHVIDSILL